MLAVVLVLVISLSFTLTATSGRLSAGLARLLETTAAADVADLPPFPVAEPLPATITPLLFSPPLLPAILPPRDLGMVVPPVPEPLGPYATLEAP